MVNIMEGLGQFCILTAMLLGGAWLIAGYPAHRRRMDRQKFFRDLREECRELEEYSSRRKPPLDYPVGGNWS